MINKIYKIINNKYSRFLKFVFFLRYLFLIFFVAIILFLSIPHFFDYKKKEKIIKNHISQNYNLEIMKMENIKFKPFPLPHLSVENLTFNYHSRKENLVSQKLIIFPKLFSIYNYQNFEVRKIKIENSKLKINSKEIRLLAYKISNLKKKYILKI